MDLSPDVSVFEKSLQVWHCVLRYNFERTSRNYNMSSPKKDIEAPSEEHIAHAKRDSGSNSDGNAASYDEKQGRRKSSTALLKNPLTGMSRQDILADVDAFVDEKGLSEHRDAFRKGALLAQVANVDNGFESIPDINETEKEVIRRETTNRWSQPFTLYFLCTLCAGSAIVQGMDQTAVNGAQVGFLRSSPLQLC